jgi:endonuclease YncB( thermonuclease family)
MAAAVLRCSSDFSARETHWSACAALRASLAAYRYTISRMRRTVAYGAVLTLLLTGAISAQLRDLVGAKFDARVVSVIDGDTVEALPSGEKHSIRIRLEGIDAPERGEPFSEAARRFTRVMLFEQNVNLEGRAVDRYGRLVARIRIGTKDTSVELVKAGLACHYTQYSSDPVLAGAQLEAVREGRGFWATDAGKPKCTQATIIAQATPHASLRQAETGFHGNTQSHVYHSPACPNYNCRNCTRLFRSEADAQAAGFRPAGDCLRR